MSDEENGVGENNGAGPHRRILKVRLRQDQVIRLHELRILQGKSIAALLEGILEEYFRRQENQTPPYHPGREATKDEAPT